MRDTMVRFMLAMVFALWGSLAVSAAELPATVLDPYLRVHIALAADKTESVKQSAAALATAADQQGAAAKTLADAARRLERTSDLKSARTAFGEVSDAMVAYAKATGATSPAGVKTMFCSMVGKPWLQKGDAIKNPYYGSEMLECGEVMKP